MVHVEWTNYLFKDTKAYILSLKPLPCYSRAPGYKPWPRSQTEQHVAFSLPQLFLHVHRLGTVSIFATTRSQSALQLLSSLTYAVIAKWQTLGACNKCEWRSWETCCCLIVILSLAPWQSAKVMDGLKMISLGSLTVELVKRTDWLFAVGHVPSHRLVREAAYFCKGPQAISLIKLVSLRMFSTNICLLFLSDDRGEKYEQPTRMLIIKHSQQDSHCFHL